MTRFIREIYSEETNAGVRVAGCRLRVASCRLSLYEGSRWVVQLVIKNKELIANSWLFEEM